MARLNTDYAIDTKAFHYDAKTRKMSEEASTVRYHGCYRLYDDACDYGIWVKSHKTGKLVPFVLKEEHRDSEGDITHWTLSCYEHRVLMTIFND